MVKGKWNFLNDTHADIQTVFAELRWIGHERIGLNEAVSKNVGHRTFLQFCIQNKIEQTFRPEKLAKFLCHNIIN